MDLSGYKKNFLLAIVPCKLTSERIKNKNIIPINGIPLYQFTLNTAKSSDAVDEICISSESEDFLKNLCDHKLHKVLRPKSLSEKKIKNFEVIKHCIDNFYKEKKFYPEFILLLQPTTPFRNFNDISEMKQIFIDNNKASSLVTINPPANIYKNQDLDLEGSNIEELRKKYNIFSEYYMLRTSDTINRDSFYGELTVPFISSSFKVNVDINYHVDYVKANDLFQKNYNRYKIWNLVKN